MYNFEKLVVYQKSLEFIALVYSKTNGWDKVYLFNITDQLRRAALSILLNIAEGSSRSPKDFKRFLDIAKGSCFESLACIQVARKLEIIDAGNQNILRNSIEEITKMLSGLKSSLTELSTRNS